MSRINTAQFNTIATSLNGELASEFCIETLFQNLIKSNESSFLVATKELDLLKFNIDVTHTYAKSINTIFDSLRVYAKNNSLTESYWMKTTVTITSETKREDGKPELTASYSFYNKANKANRFTITLGSMFEFIRSDVDVYIDMNSNTVQELAKAIYAISLLDRDSSLVAERNNKVLTAMFA